MNTIAIVGGGVLEKSFIKEIRSAQYVIGVDRGAYWLIANSVIPNIAIGDFDSVNVREFQMIKNNVKRVRKYPKKKNFTDMELAIDYVISLRPKEVIIYGAIGTRVDHTMGNIYLLEMLNEKGVIRDENNEVRIMSGQFVLKKEPRFPYVSVLPVSDSIEISLTGFLYDLSHALIRRGQMLGISNEIREDEATIEVHRGKALVIRSRD